MPTNRRYRRHERRPDLSELSADQRQELETGRPFFGGFKRDRAALEEAWDLHGEAILAEFIAKHPATRPFAWWLLEHGQERPIVHPEPGPQEQLDALRVRTWNFLHTSILWGPLDQWGPLQEPEPDYLKRLGLLEPGEYEAYQERERAA
jgi:hypothetical protein